MLLVRAHAFGRLVLKATQLGFSFGPRKPTREPGSHGSTKWFYDKHGKVVYGERPTPPPHPTPTPTPPGTAVALKPALAIRVGTSHDVRAVADYREASALWSTYRDAHHLGASNSPFVSVVDTTTGATVARVSYNGRVWSVPGDTLLFDTRAPDPPAVVPVSPERPLMTVAQAESMGAAGFETGLRAPAQDPAFWAEIKRLSAAGVKFVDHLDAWNRGHAERNMSNTFLPGEKVRIMLGEMLDSKFHRVDLGEIRATVRKFDPATGHLEYDDAKGGGGIIRYDRTNALHGWAEALSPSPAKPTFALTPPSGAPAPAPLRPAEAKTYADHPTAQAYEVMQSEYVARQIERKAKTAHGTATAWREAASKERPGTKRHRDATYQAEWWEKDAAQFDAHDPEREEQARRDAKLQYLKLVKDAISKGKAVPMPVVLQSMEFRKALAGRMTWEKGRNTSFGNLTSGVDNSMQEVRGYKCKRQDGKPILHEQREEIATGVAEIEEVLGPLADVLRKTDVTVAHTSGRHPFMRGNAGGLYSSGDRTVSIGIKGITGKPIPALAHELAGHFLDFEAGRALNKESRRWRSSGKTVTSSSLAEADARNYVGVSPGRALISRATDTINNTRAVAGVLSKQLGTTTNKDAKAEIERAKVSLGPYWREPAEVWARLVEQFVATKRGQGPGVSHDSPDYYGNHPGWWMPEIFAQLMPDIEREIQRRLTAIRAGAAA